MMVKMMVQGSKAARSALLLLKLWEQAAAAAETGSRPAHSALCNVSAVRCRFIITRVRDDHAILLIT